MDLEKEIKKLNYALESYKCKYHADFEEDTNLGKVTLFLFDSGEMPVMESVIPYGPDFENSVKAFKVHSINKCTHGV